MFTGIVEELGTIRSVTPNATGARLEVAAHAVLQDVHIGDSITHNGCCLTVVEILPDSYVVEAVEETLRVTSLGRLQPGDRVNLERSLKLSDRLGGHIVQGHVDGVGSLTSRQVEADGSLSLRFEAPAEILRYVVYKGSIAVDGVSLTVARVDATSFTVAIIPHTQAVTTLGLRAPGEQVNLETDVIARYLEKLQTS